jgi:hypothetical protein
MRMLITQFDQTLIYRWSQFNRAGIAICAAAAVVFGTVCGVGGSWLYFMAPPQVLVDVQTGAEQRQDQPDGSRLCRISGLGTDAAATNKPITSRQSNQLQCLPIYV